MNEDILKAEIEAKQTSIHEKQKQIDLLKEGIALEKKILKVLTDGLNKLNSHAHSTEGK